MTNHMNGKNLETIQNMNRALIIKLLLRGKYRTRIALAHASGLKRATISNIIDDFIKWGLVKEVGNISGKKGRRSIALELNTRHYLTICSRIDRGSVSFGIFDMGANCLDGIQKIRTESMPPREVVNIIVEHITGLIDTIEKSKIGKLIGIGFAVPGPYIQRSGEFVVLSHAPEWNKFDLRDEISKHFSIPVFFEHDANCAALAEWWYGDCSAKYSSLLFLCAGYGIGAGIIENGQILSGALGIAGEVGHMSINFSGSLCECGSKGCWELYASAYALIKEVKRLMDKGMPTSLDPGVLSVENIIDAINNGDPLAQKAFERISWALGFGIVNLVNIYNPEIIFIGDVLSRTGQRLLNIVYDVVREHLPQKVYSALKIELSHFTKEDFTLHGANAMIFDNILNDVRLVTIFCRE
ncbi:MAG: ROK family protein [Bacillota bacterium]